MRKLGSLIAALALAAASGVAAAEWQALPSKAPEPADNPTTPEKVDLGRILYHDPRLSSAGTVSCASCHNVMGGGEDNRAGSVGVQAQVGGRSAPTVWNSAFNATQFWDGRAPSLEAQAKGPVTNPIEMGMKSWDDVVARLKAIPGYAALFADAFPGATDAITADNSAKAIAAYERTLITPNSPYDKFAAGDKAALNEQQQRGAATFAEVGCGGCHSGPAFNGSQMGEGAGVYQKFPGVENGALEAQYGFSKDPGRFEVTKNEADRHLFKVPTLRNIALTAPYFHNGSVKSLEDAVKIMAKLQLNKELTPQQAQDITAFLTALTGEFPRQDMPRLPGYTGKAFDFAKN
ncbi:MAG: cytochrome-c peroxidase [Candidatus Methylumidiphilus sp.]